MKARLSKLAALAGSRFGVGIIVILAAAFIASVKIGYSTTATWIANPSLNVVCTSGCSGGGGGNVVVAGPTDAAGRVIVVTPSPVTAVTATVNTPAPCSTEACAEVAWQGGAPWSVTQGGSWSIANAAFGISGSLPSGTNVIGGVTQSGTWTVTANQGTSPWTVTTSAPAPSTPLPTASAGLAPPASAPYSLSYNTCMYNAVLATLTAGNVGMMACDSSGRQMVNIAAQSLSPIVVTTPAPVATMFVANTPGVTIQNTPGVSIQSVASAIPVTTTTPIACNSPVVLATATAAAAPSPTALVAGSSGKSIYICGASFTVGTSTAANGGVGFSTGVTCATPPPIANKLTGAYGAAQAALSASPVPIQVSIPPKGDGRPIFQVASGQPLCLYGNGPFTAQGYVDTIQQ